MTLRILFIHPNFPGQYKHLAKHFAQQPKVEAVFISKELSRAPMQGIRHITYRPPREASATTHRYLIGTERAVLQGQEVWRICRKLKQQDFTPDIICVHPGWGDGLYLKDIYPNAVILGYFEFFYHYQRADVNFDPELDHTLDDAARIRTKNAINLLNLEAMDWGITPTHWQKSVHPLAYQPKISVLHEGVDTDAVAPKPNASVTHSDGSQWRRGDPLITYVTRNFEHYRGAHQFFRAVKRIQEQHPTAHVVAVGADNVSYGRAAPNGKNYRHMLLDEVGLDLSRISFPGQIDYATFVTLLQASTAHIYLSVPFVLSWSMLEAMSAGCVVIGSATAPVQEVIEDGKNGLLVDFFSPQQIANTTLKVLENPEKYAPIRQQARETIRQRYDLKHLLPKQIQLIEQLANKQIPPALHSSLDAPISSDFLFQH